MKYTGICLVTENIPALVRFYETVFCTQASGNDEHAELSFGGLNMAIFSRKGMEQMAEGCMRNAGTGALTLMFEVENVDAEYERLKSLNIEIVKLPATYPWGARSVWFRDLDGNIVDFFTVVSAS